MGFIISTLPNKQIRVGLFIYRINFKKVNLGPYKVSVFHLISYKYIRLIY